MQVSYVNPLVTFLSVNTRGINQEKLLKLGNLDNSHRALNRNSKIRLYGRERSRSSIFEQAEGKVSRLRGDRGKEI